MNVPLWRLVGGGQGEAFGKVAIVTGAGNGMGRATALLFAGKARPLSSAMSTQPAGESAAAEIEAAGGGPCSSAATFPLRPRSRLSWRPPRSGLASSTRSSDNAGIEQPVTPSQDVTEALFDKVIGINLKGTFFRLQARHPALLRSRRRNDRE